MCRTARFFRLPSIQTRFSSPVLCRFPERNIPVVSSSFRHLWTFVCLLYRPSLCGELYRPTQATHTTLSPVFSSAKYLRLTVVHTSTTPCTILVATTTLPNSWWCAAGRGGTTLQHAREGTQQQS